jgi:methylmalonyl-CoA mutase
MEKNKNLEIDWAKKIINDLGAEKYNALFTSTDEEIDIAPFYVKKENFIINPDNLLFPKKWNIINEVDCIKSNDLGIELKNLSDNEITNVILRNFNKIDLTKYDLNKLNISLKINNVEDFKVSQYTKYQIIFEPNLKNSKNLELKKYIGKSYNLNISSEFFKDSGANIVQEIAFSLSAANEYLNEFGSEIIEKISFELIQGGNYFLEIAKIQALRILWALITKEYGNQIDNCIITAKPSVKNKTSNNFNNNIIRSTSECMSGILGGCNYIKSIAYDVTFKEKNSFSERIMNNQLLILKNETSISKVNNAVSGSYFITYLIEELTQKSLNLFKKIENEGGYYKSLNKKNLFNEILTNSKSVQRQYKLKEKILIGYNKFIDE